MREHELKEHHRPVREDEAPTEFVRGMRGFAQPETYRFVVRILRILLDQPTQWDELLPRIDRILSQSDQEEALAVS